MQAMGVETKPPNVQVMDHSNPLARLNGVHIEQVRRIAEACLGCEMANEYMIYELSPTPGHKSGPELVHVKEVGSSFCNRQCCGPCRHLTAEMYTVHDNRPIGTYRKGQGLAWCVGCCAATATLVTNVGKGGEQHYDVGNPHGCQCPGCTPLGFTIGDFDFRGDCSCCGHTPCGQYVFNVTNKNTGAEDGSVVKLRQGCADIFYKINKYSLTFPADATEEQKVQLIAAAIHSDFNYFEQKKNNN
ncbi:phospholipid scramblase [Chloropicon roscoffensis]|uniref:Phospholipid scramblase n=1 Tax=Chloropicon roscoffensis TaxID=1461544 RepID=A0AAX4PGJ2_9CHLO